MINKLLKYFFVLTFWATNLLAQDFTISVHNDYQFGSLGSEMIFTIDLTNNSNSELSVSVVRRENNILADWSSSLCFDWCFAPHLDSISTTENYNSTPLAVGETREISLHVFPLVNDGVGFVTLDFINDLLRSESYSVQFEAATITVSVNDGISMVNDYKLSQNYPNPFNPSTNIAYSIYPTGSSAEFVSVKVFDLLGREVASLVNEYQQAGNYSVQFNSQNFTSGVYFYELKTDNFHQIKKMILEK